jgi:hypothetical protein
MITSEINTDRFGGIAASAAAWEAKCRDYELVLARIVCGDCEWCYSRRDGSTDAYCINPEVLGNIHTDDRGGDTLCLGWNYMKEDNDE